MSGHDHDHEAGHHHEYVDAGVEARDDWARVNRRLAVLTDPDGYALHLIEEV